MSPDLGPSLAWPQSPTVLLALVLEHATEHPLCFSLLIPTEITASLLPPAIGKTVKFAHTKCLQQRLALCCHFSWDSDTSLMFNLVFFFSF